jgi:serine protease
MRKGLFIGLLIVASVPLTYAQGNGGGWKVIEDGMPPVMIHPTLGDAGNSHAAVHAAGLAGNLNYGGGPVQSAPAVYLVLWGSQWSNDPSGEASILENFYNGIGGSSWLSVVDQYCSTAVCSQSTKSALGVWHDNGSSAPSHPSQSQLAAEAAKAANTYFKDFSANSQYVIATAHGNNSRGFGIQWCAYHSTTSASGKTISWTNLPYITDAGANCGANFNGLGANAGITIVSGHEMAESVTDPFPNSGWVDSSGAEIGDKCAWITTGNPGASADTTLGTWGTFAVQSLWSNAASGCPNVPAK